MRWRRKRFPAAAKWRPLCATDPARSPAAERVDSPSRRLRLPAGLLWLSTLAGVVAPLPLAGQHPSADPHAPAVSMGLPSHFAWYTGALGVADRLGTDPVGGGQALFGIEHEFIRPVIGILGAAAEAYGGVVDGSPEGGARLFATVRAFLLRAGLDFHSDGPWPPSAILAVEDPVIRGGLFGAGGTIRFEWTPARERIGLGLVVPLWSRRGGKTRPSAIHATPPPVPARDGGPAAPDSTAATLLRQIHTSAEWIDYLTTPYVEASLLTDREWVAELEGRLAYMRATDAEFPLGHRYPQEVLAYHRRVEALFAHALGAAPEDDRAGALAALARERLLADVVIPANRDFGQLRRQELFDALFAAAEQRFAETFRAGDAVPHERRSAVRAAYAGWLDVVGAVVRAARARWEDSRLVWVPFQLALRPEDHDTQAEVDAIVERLVGTPLKPGNDFTYLINEAFSPELIRTIGATRRYHVLWIHDFPGHTPDGTPDPVSASVVADGYLTALTRRVEEFDSTGILPVFMIFLDQWYFDVHGGRRWMGLLQDPLGIVAGDRAGDAESLTRVRAAQRALREAVSRSRRLQELAAERGTQWLRQYVSVRVSITYPPDPSFRHRLSAPQLSMRISDDYMRDHRKVVFYDLTERDPAVGAALFTGEGVGEEYGGAQWEDRTLLVRGPAVVGLKAEARALLRSQGLGADEIPLPLRPEPFPAEHQQRTDSSTGDWTARLLHAHNATGFGPKHASALKAALYNLMPAGSRILAPDSQWSSYFWAGMLVGAALRGGMVFVVAPRSDNAPYGDAEVQTVLTHDVLEGYLQIRELMRSDFEAAGGGLWIGVYGQDIGTRSIGQRYRAVIDGLLDPAFPRAAFPFSADIYRQLASVETLERLLGPTRGLPSPPPLSDKRRSPKLHLKAQLFASREGLERLLADPAWFEVFVRYVQLRATEYARDPRLAAAGEMSPSLLAPLDSSLNRAPAPDRAHDVFYLLTGSQNQNDRSLLLDGEILCLVAGSESLATLIDFVAIAARSTWVNTIPELDALVPRLPRGTVRTARALRSLF